jgi:hypothetical protein
MRNQKIILSVMVAISALTLTTYGSANTVFASTATDENGFNQGYNLGLAQGQIGHQAKIFHIGAACIGQTLAWCNGYTSGYLDGFFSTLPTNTVTHSTTKIIVHREHHRGLPSCDKITVGSCKDLGDKPSTPSTPNPAPSTPPSTPSTPSGSDSGSSSGSSSSGSDKGNSNSGSSSGSN